MRLLHTKELYMQEFFDKQTPRYAILSHVWGDEEISYQDFLNIRKLQDPRYAAYHELLRLDLTRSERSAGYIKIIRCCAKAASDSSDWVWIDTCCIDKRSSAELQETINSMYKWYRRSEVCYAYLIDVEDGSVEQFSASAWFKRGWTLQELLAPEHVMFLDRSWREFTTKHGSAGDISTFTGIPQSQLASLFEPWQSSVAERMSWAAHRRTTRVEDTSYCLLGLFSINMPLLYGEGQVAFLRLQEEIIRKTPDESIFAWRDVNIPLRFWLMAGTPDSFAGCMANTRNLPYRLPGDVPIMTNRGLQMDAYVIPSSDGEITVSSYPELRHVQVWGPRFLVLLHCGSPENRKALVVCNITAESLEEIYVVLTCVDLGPMGIGQEEILRRGSRKTIYLMPDPSRWMQEWEGDFYWME